MSAAVTKRDLEILRSLLRVQLATTGALQTVFFSQLRLARRRLAALRERGYIAIHSKGLPGPTVSAAARHWRLTSAGVDLVSARFLNERIPNNAVSRAANASLRFFEHRAAIAELYFQIIADRDRDIAAVSKRADRIVWRGEYDLELAYDDEVDAELVPRRIIPDATMETGTGRFFLELDRSTETRGRCRRTILAYSSHVEQGHFARQSGEDLAPYLVYVTRSDQRARNLRALVAELELALRVTALAFDEAVPWLRQAAFGEIPAGPVSALTSDAPPADVLGVLRDVYELARQQIQYRRDRGEQVEAPACLRDAYALLEQLSE